MMQQHAGSNPLCQCRTTRMRDAALTCNVDGMTSSLLQRIDKRLQELGLSDEAASKKAGLHRDTIRDLRRNRRSGLTVKSMTALAQALEVSASWLMTGETDHLSSEDVAAGLSGETHRENNGASAAAPFKGEVPGSIPEIDARAGAGVGSVGEHEIVKVREGESIVGHKVISEWLFPSPYLRHELRANPGKTVVLEVIGDSMSPTLESGDRVLVDTSYQRPNPDGIYVIDDGDGPMVKRVQLVRPSNPEQIRIISDNKNQEPYSRLLSEIRIVGRVAGRLTSM